MIEIVTTPTVESVLLHEAKEHLRELGTDFDGTILPDYITTAIEYVEGRLDSRLQLNNATYDERFREWFALGRPYRLEAYPVQSITSVKYDDEDFVEQTLAGSQYLLTAPTYGVARLELDPDADALPLLHAREYPIVVRYVAGFGSLATDVPQAIRSAVKLACQGMFEGRLIQLMPTIDSLLSPYHAGVYV